MDTKSVGDRGEDAAAAFLERVGYRIAERNWQCRLGELDIVAWDGPVLVLCEVKTRRTRKAGSPEEAVGPTKQRRISRLAAAYISEHGLEPESVRFDVVALDVLGADRALLRHHRAAFVVQG